MQDSSSRHLHHTCTSADSNGLNDTVWPNETWYLQFIGEIEKYPVLWDTRLKSYADQTISFETWNEIAYKFGLDVYTCKKMWRNLSEMLQIKMKRSPFEVQECKICNKMQFLMSQKEDNAESSVIVTKQELDDDDEITIEDVPTIKLEYNTDMEENQEDFGWNDYTQDDLNKNCHTNALIPDLNIQILNTVKQYPCLWDKHSPDYNDKELIAQTWEYIASMLNDSDEEVKRKWLILRQRFRYRIKRYCNSEITFDKLSSWKYFQAAEYLLEPIKKNIHLTLKNYVRVYAKLPEKNVEHENKKPKYDETVETGHNKLLKTCNRDFIINEEKKLLKLQQRVEKEFDDDYMFLMSLLPILRKLPLDINMQLRIKIHDAVYQESLNS